jgi:ribosome-interacting GTPase 1
MTQPKKEPDNPPLITTTGQLKAKLAKLKRELLTPSSSGGGGGAGFDVARTGVASVYVHALDLIHAKS